MHIVIPDPIAITDADKDRFTALGVQYYDDIPEDSDALIDRIQDAELITANYVDITARVIDSAPKLRYIVVPSVGYEWVDVAHAHERGIQVLNCPTYNSQAVAEHAVTLLLATSRRLLSAAESLRGGEWNAAQFQGLELRGKTLGLIGHGNIGKRIERFIKGFGMTVTIVDSKSSAMDIDTLMSTADVVCACIPLTGQTKHLLDAKRIGLLKKGAVIVNVGRGAVIDQAALEAALQSGDILGAGLDVFEDEPLTGKPGAAIVRLATMPNVIATPHMAFNTDQTVLRMGKEVYDDILSCIDGSPQNLVPGSR